MDPCPPHTNSLCYLGDPAAGPDLAFSVLSDSPRVGLLLAAGRLLGIEALYGHRIIGLGAGRDLTQSSGLAAFL